MLWFICASAVTRQSMKAWEISDSPSSTQGCEGRLNLKDRWLPNRLDIVRLAERLNVTYGKEEPSKVWVTGAVIGVLRCYEAFGPDF